MKLHFLVGTAIVVAFTTLIFAGAARAHNVAPTLYCGDVHVVIMGGAKFPTCSLVRLACPPGHSLITPNEPIIGPRVVCRDQG